MNYQETLNSILNLAKRHKDGFDKQTYYRHMESIGFPRSDANSFYLTSMKKAGLITNPKLGLWMLTEYGRTLEYVTEEISERVHRARVIKTRTSRKRSPRVMPEPKQERASDVDVISLILEIRKANPKADITKLAALL